MNRGAVGSAGAGGTLYTSSGSLADIYSEARRRCTVHICCPTLLIRLKARKKEEIEVNILSPLD